MEVKNETQINRKNKNKDSQDEDGDSESIYEYGNNQSENEQRYNIRNKRAPKYYHMKTVGYLNYHVKTISHLNILRAISKFHNPDHETTLMTHYLL